MSHIRPALLLMTVLLKTQLIYFTSVKNITWNVIVYLTLNKSDFIVLGILEVAKLLFSLKYFRNQNLLKNWWKQRRKSRMKVSADILVGVLKILNYSQQYSDSRSYYVI